MTTHKMNLITNIQQMQQAIGLRIDNIEDIQTYSPEFLEKKRDKLIKEYNKTIKKF